MSREAATNTRQAGVFLSDLITLYSLTD